MTTDRVTEDGVRLSSEYGGYIRIDFPEGWVDDLGDPIWRAYHVRGWARAEAAVERVRAWQNFT